MCEWSKWGDTRIDPCMRKLIKNLNACGLKTEASCCGHGKYEPTIVIRKLSPFGGFELFSSTHIPRIKKFYKRDEEGVYRIPEVVEAQKRIPRKTWTW